MLLIWLSASSLDAAFGKIVSSFVADVIMPPIGVMMGGVNFSDLAYTIQEAAGDVPAVVIKYGAFIQTVVDFIIVAFAIFIAVKVMNSLKKEEEAAPEEEPAPSKEEVLLTEIRDILKNK